MLSFLTKRGSQNLNLYMLFHLGREIEDGANYFCYRSLIFKEHETFAFFIEFKGFFKSQHLRRIYRMQKGYALFVYRIKSFSRHSAVHYILSASSVIDFFRFLYCIWPGRSFNFSFRVAPLQWQLKSFEHGFILAESVLF